MTPWREGKATFRIQTPPRGEKGRIRTMRQMKEAALTGLKRSPYVSVGWGDSDKPSLGALLDTGADWSLLDVRQLSVTERDELEMTEKTGQGVSGESVDVIGVTWRTVTLGEIRVEQQRFVVVRGMITPVILGADFWCRIPPITLDFVNGKLSIEGMTEPVGLYDSGEARVSSVQESVNHESRPIRTGEEVHIPPHSQILIKGEPEGLKEERNCLIEPLEAEDPFVRAAYSVDDIQGGTVWVKLINLGTEERILEAGETIATLVTEKWKQEFEAGRIFAQAETNTKRDWSQLCCSQLPPDKRDELSQILQRFSKVFYEEGELPLVKIGVEHTVRLNKDVAPVARRPRRLSAELEQEVRTEIEDLKRMGVIKESNSPWAAPIVCARRANGKLRLAIDYRAVNSHSSPATLHPIPLIEDLIDRLAEAEYFSVLDAKAGYHQMPLKDDDCEITAFVTPWAQYEWNRRTPFGLSGAGYSFQRMMCAILGECNFIEALCYLDDILVWGRTWEEHRERLIRVLTKVETAGLGLSFEKCRFGLKEVEYLGCVVRNGMITMSEQRVADLRSIATPSTIRELRQALGAIMYVQRWLPGLAEVARPLYKGLDNKPRAKLKWTKDMEDAFRNIKQLIGDAVALRLPDLKRPFFLVTDCSNEGAGAMLAQADPEEEGALCPVAFYHHSLTEPETRYGTTDKEMLAVVLAVKRFRVYLAKEFNLITDHRALKSLQTMSMEDMNDRRSRWLLFLQQFQIKPIHKAGKSSVMSMADYLSRVRSDGSHPNTAEIRVTRERIESAVVEFPKLLEAQLQDQTVSGVRNVLRTGTVSGGTDGVNGNWRDEIPTEEGKKMMEKQSRLFIDPADGLLKLRYNGGRRTGQKPFGVRESNRVVVPLCWRKQILRLVHDGPLAGHMGVDRTWSRLRDWFWWPQIKEDLQTYIKGCEACAVNKHSNLKIKAPMQETSIPEAVCEKIQIDFAGPFPRAESHDFRYFLQIQDVLSRFVIFIPCEDCTAETAAKAVYERWVCVFLLPDVIVSDHGSHFAGEVFRTMCTMAGIEQRMGAPGHACSQGQVERQNQLLNQAKCLANNSVELWPEAIIRIQASHNSSISSATGFKPVQLMVGQQPRCPEQTVTSERGQRLDTTIRPGDDAATRARKLVIAKEEVLGRAVKSARQQIQANQKKRVDNNSQEEAEQYELGDRVRRKLSDSERAGIGGKKVAPRYSGAYKVTKKIGQGWTYELTPEPGTDGRPKKRHFNDLKPAHTMNHTSVERLHDSIGDDMGSQMSDDDPQSEEEDQPDEVEIVQIPEMNDDPGPSERRVRDEGSEVDDDDAENANEDLDDSAGYGAYVPPSLREVRWSSRERKQFTRMQVDGRKKRYSAT